jgi:hypothetical protein
MLCLLSELDRATIRAETSQTPGSPVFRCLRVRRSYLRQWLFLCSCCPTPKFHPDIKRGSPWSLELAWSSPGTSWLIGFNNAVSQYRSYVAATLPELALLSRLTIQRRGQPPYTTHGHPVVFVGRSANDANLIVLSMSAVRPGEPMRAECLKK